MKYLKNHKIFENNNLKYLNCLVNNDMYCVEDFLKNHNPPEQILNDYIYIHTLHVFNTINTAAQNYKLNKIFIDNNFDINGVDNNKKTPLFIATLVKFKNNNTSIKIVKLLLENGADINHIDKNDNNVLLKMLQVEWPVLDKVKRIKMNIIKLLLKNGIDINHQNYYNSSVLLSTTFNFLLNKDETNKRYNKDLLYLLIENNADWNILDEDELDFIELIKNNLNLSSLSKEQNIENSMFLNEIIKKYSKQYNLYLAKKKSKKFNI